MEFIQSSWKAIIALVGGWAILQLPQLEILAQDWAGDVIKAAFLAIGVWLKANVPAEA